uniref:HVA22-like protein n=1 Tax=Aegilops tauschii subsp. strangulata TaxID=200361 RepID=A0A452XEY9_AEGTS
MFHSYLYTYFPLVFLQFFLCFFLRRAFWGYVMQLYVIPKVILGFLMPLLQDRSSSSTYRLRFLMEYIVVLYILFILDAITGVLFLRIPLYYELELAFIMYLWHPR